jgi:hypothetical protein
MDASSHVPLDTVRHGEGEGEGDGGLVTRAAPESHSDNGESRNHHSGMASSPMWPNRPSHSPRRASAPEPRAMCLPARLPRLWVNPLLDGAIPRHAHYPGRSLAHAAARRMSSCSAKLATGMAQ